MKINFSIPKPEKLRLLLLPVSVMSPASVPSTCSFDLCTNQNIKNQPFAPVNCDLLYIIMKLEMCRHLPSTAVKYASRDTAWIAPIYDNFHHQIKHITIDLKQLQALMQ